MSEHQPATVAELLQFVKASRGFDFTGYKRASIERRIAKRMAEVGVEAGRYDEYIDYLELHAGEFAELFNTILINVTSFFRDPETWERLEAEGIPQMLAARAENSPLRVWCAGCASGEEAYTAAIVFARVLGDTAFQQRVKIYATDVDEQALDQARHGAYLPRQAEGLPADALQRFFESTGQRYVFRKDLRRSVIFGSNDLVRDAPISRIDLLVCRNTLMYFTAETQAQILRRFHFALDDDGLLLLGKSEMLITHGDLFTPVDSKWRLFRKVIRPSLRERERTRVAAAVNGASADVAEDLREAAFDVTSFGSVVLDADGVVVMANNAARRMFGLGARDLGRPIRELDLFLSPIELRRHLEVLASERRSIEIRAARWHHNDQDRILDLRIVPLNSDRTLIGTNILYIDVTSRHNLRHQLHGATRELEQAQEDLRSTIEELETTNEELETTNEELETTNEELQSTNEELETMNEELQSSNAEIETSNEQLRQRTLEVHDTNALLERVLTALGLAVMVLDAQQRVVVWNGQARELWGLTADETVGQHLLSLDIGLPIQKLKASVRACLSGESVREVAILPATNRRGKAFQCRVTCLSVPDVGDDGDAVVIIMMEPADTGVVTPRQVRVAA
ncbi:MAG: CheR family methyltransferase [Solirubrobacteraceae bacterium]